MDVRVHIFTATALGRGRVASPTLGCFLIIVIIIIIIIIIIVINNLVEFLKFYNLVV